MLRTWNSSLCFKKTRALIIILLVFTFVCGCKNSFNKLIENEGLIWTEKVIKPGLYPAISIEVQNSENGKVIYRTEARSMSVTEYDRLHDKPKWVILAYNNYQVKYNKVAEPVYDYLVLIDGRNGKIGPVFKQHSTEYKIDNDGKYLCIDDGTDKDDNNKLIETNEKTYYPELWIYRVYDWKLIKKASFTEFIGMNYNTTKILFEEGQFIVWIGQGIDSDNKVRIINTK